MTRRLVADRYRLGDRIGSGGMGRVWLALDELLHRNVALKEILLPEGLAEDDLDELRMRTLREARTAARLTHPNVVRVYDVVFTDDRPWIVMEYVRSRSLAQVIRDDGPFTPQETAQIGLALLDALSAAHMVGVLHRDVKPGNVLLADDGRIMLTDFGLATFDEVGAALTQSGIVHGSPQFISPERALDGTSTSASDMWSLGATLYAAVEGHSPYSRPSAYETIAALTTEDPDPTVRAAELVPLLLGLLARHPADRMRAAVVRARLRLIVADDADLDPDAPRRLAREIESREIEQPVAESAEVPEHSGETPPISESSGAHRRASTGPQHFRRRTRRRASQTPIWLVVTSVIAALLVFASLIIWQTVSHHGDRASAATADSTPTGLVSLTSSGGPPPFGPPGGPGGPRPRAFAPPPVGLAWLCGPTSPPTTSIASPAKAPPGAPHPKPGWQWYADSTGAVIAIPTGMRMGFAVDGTTCLYGPIDGRVIAVGRWKAASRDPVAVLRAHIKDLEADGGLPLYQLLGGPHVVACISMCAQWSYGYGTPNGIDNVMVRDFVQPDGTVYALTWASTAEGWDDAQVSIGQMMGSFRLTTK